jgi:acylphosphatase
MKENQASLHGVTRLTARVYGRVQGVGFRAFVACQARRLAVTGWTRNCPDGSVEAVAEGPEERLRLLQALLARGPSGAVVERVDGEWGEASAEFPGFNIRY